jgi:hypothetical protein
MKISVICGFYFVIIISGKLFSQDNQLQEKKCFIIKTDLFNPIINLLNSTIEENLTAEVGFANRNSVQLTGVYSVYNHQSVQNTGEINKIARIAIQAIADYKFYWKVKKNFSGFYSGIYLKYSNYNNTYTGWGGTTNIRMKESGLGGGGVIGYQNYIKKHFVLDALIGVGSLNAIITPKYNQIQTPVVARIPVGLDLRASISIGYKF